MNGRAVAEWFASLCLLHVVLATPAAAYVDPGTAGILSQVLYVLFYAALGLFVYLLRYIKQYMARAKQFVAGIFGGGS
ncbi:MAG: hypothetical protein ACREQO_23455 [Candidatus Binatia bacterium]